MRQPWLRLGDSFTVQDEGGAVAYRVHGKPLRVRKTSVIKTASGTVVATVREVLLAIDRTTAIEIGGSVVGKVKRTHPNALTSSFEVEILGRVELIVRDAGFKDFRIEREGATAAAVRKRDLGILDTYDLTISEGEDEGLILAVAVALDQMDPSSD